MGCLGCGRLRWWWSFGLGQLTAQIKVWLRFQSCGWLLGCQKLGEKEGTERCKNTPIFPSTPCLNMLDVSKVRVGKEFISPSLQVQISFSFSHQRPTEQQVWGMHQLIPNVPADGVLQDSILEDSIQSCQMSLVQAHKSLLLQVQGHLISLLLLSHQILSHGCGCFCLYFMTSLHLDGRSYPFRDFSLDL